jgi:CubicO group peptidase (beta-lactamase class C family)
VDELRESVDDIAHRTGFSGAIRVDDRSGQLLAAAYGLADRANGIANTVDTRFAVASGTKTTTVVIIIGDGLR